LVKSHRLAAGLLLLLAMTAGCGSPPGAADHASASSSGAASLPRITIQRSGGFAGVRDTVTVDPYGAWNATNRAGAHSAGSLSPEQVSEIRALAGDPRLAAEAGRPRPPTRCRDAFTYQLTVSGAQIAYADCPADPDQPSASIALVKAILGYTISSPSRGS
jgi:hypothetical protein